MIVGPNGDPISSEPQSGESTMADLAALLERMGEAQRNFATKQSNRVLLGEAAWWLVNLAQRCVELQAQAPPPVAEPAGLEQPIGT